MQESLERRQCWSGRLAHSKGTAAQCQSPEHPMQSMGRRQSGTPELGPAGTPTEGLLRPGCSTLQFASKKHWACRQVPGPLPLCNLFTATIKHPPSPDPSDSPTCPFFPHSKQSSLSSSHTSQGGLGALLGSTAREGAWNRLCLHLHSSRMQLHQRQRSRSSLS